MSSADLSTTDTTKDMKHLKITLLLSAALLFSCTDKPQNDPEPAYYHKMLAMEFTSVNCTYCPGLAESMENIQDRFPGRTSVAAFHSESLGSDPMSLPLNDKILNKVTTGQGLPMFSLDFRKSSQHITSQEDLIASEIELQLEKYKSDCGVAIESEYNNTDGKIVVTAKFKSSVAASYRYHIFLIEDGVEYMQAGQDGTYTHMNVVREIAADNIYGTRLNQGNALEAGKEYQVERTFDMNKAWNPANMRVIACIMKSGDGSTYTCDNCNECTLGGKADYIFEK